MNLNELDITGLRAMIVDHAAILRSKGTLCKVHQDDATDTPRVAICMDGDTYIVGVFIGSTSIAEAWGSSIKRALHALVFLTGSMVGIIGLHSLGLNEFLPRGETEWSGEIDVEAFEHEFAEKWEKQDLPFRSTSS